jgi:DNA polymerase alpha-associated DNA helicase A
MNETIAAFPSKALYLNKLISAAGVAKRRLIELPTVQDPTSDDAKDVLSETLVFFDTAGTEMYERTEGDIGGKGGTSASEGSRYNENEAEVVCRWTKRLVGLPPW